MRNNRRITLMRPSEVFDNFMDEFFNTPSVSWSASAVQVDMSEDNENIFVTLKAPGFKREDVEIHIEGDTLTVSGEIKEENEEEDKKKNYFMREIRNESFRRSMTLPSKVDHSNADAKVEDGMIKITLPKLPESKPQKIEIKAE